MSRKYLDICRILSGSVVRDSEGIIYASEKSRRPYLNIHYEGQYNGGTSARLFGLSVRSQKFEIKGNTKSITESCYRTLSLMGNPVQVEQPEQAECVLIWRYMLNPVILAMEIKGKEVILTGFTARQPLGQLACFRMMNKFYQPLKDMLEVKEGNKLSDRDPKQSREEKKKEKEQEKESNKKEAQVKRPQPEEKKTSRLENKGKNAGKRLSGKRSAD